MPPNTLRSTNGHFESRSTKHAGGSQTSRPSKRRGYVRVNLPATPLEKVFLWRILRLLELNIQLIFVDDGPHRPWKRDKRGGGKIDYEQIRLSRQLFDHLRVPYHRAPAEAEAECARMQAAGIVDAVWSDDCDAFMLGCEVLIKAHKVGSKRMHDQIRVYHAADLARDHDLDAESAVLFAMLAGGDYNTKGLVGCGPKAAALVAKRENGLAHALCHATQADLPAWRQTLQATLQRYGKRICIPPTFLDWKALCHYRSPIVSTPDQLHNLRGLHQGWDRAIDQPRLRVFFRQRFNFTTRDYLRHIAPVLLARALARATPSQRRENLAYGIQLKRTVVRKKTKVTEAADNDNGDDLPKVERKIIFSPLPAADIDLATQPPEEDLSKFAAKDGTPYDPLQNIECEILECFLLHGLPNGTLDGLEETSTGTKRKANSEVSEAAAPEVKRKRPAKDSDEPRKSYQPAKKRGRPVKAPDTGTHDITGSEKTPLQPAIARPTDPPRAVFRTPRALLQTSVIELLASDDSESEVESVRVLRETPTAVAQGSRLFEARGPGHMLQRQTLTPRVPEVIDLT